MKTYKIIFFEQNLDINSVITFHNIVSDYEFIESIAIQIYTMELLPMVKCFKGDEELTVEFNHLLQHRLRDVKKACAQFDKEAKQYARQLR